MPINFSLLTSRLKEFENETKQSEASKYIWKPSEGLQTVRIVPYKHNPDSPFIELKFYYKLAGKNYLAPSTFGKPDPIAEFVETLRTSGVKAQYELSKKIEAKSRTYAPIIVRGKEHEGIKFWGFGVTVYKQLLKLMTNPKWGDITSLADGNDIEVEFHKESKKKALNGQSFPETLLTPDPRKTPAVDPTKSELLVKMKDQPDILSIWPLPTYDDLKFALDRYLNPPLESAADESTDDVDDTTATDVPAVTPASSTSQEDIEKKLKEFFNQPTK